MYNYAIGSLDGAPDIARALGNMVVAWARAEDELVIALNHISGMDANMALAAYHRIPTFESRVKMIRAIIEEWKPKSPKYDKEAIDKEIQKLSKLAGTRNGYIHGAWQINESKTKIYLIDMRASADSTSKVKEVKAADIENHTATVRRRTSRIEELFGDPIFE